MDKDQHRRELKRLEKLANTLDTAIRLPGTRLSIGLDGLLGFIPVLGDSLTLVSGLWIVHRASKLNVRKRTLARMLANLGIDTAIGAIPVAGDLFDIFWKANRRNIILLKQDIENHSKD